MHLSLPSRGSAFGGPGTGNCPSLVLIAVSLLGVVTSANAARPNILVCIADDWGWPDAGAYGLRRVQTPAFDRVAAEGVLFDNAYAASPSCTASRNAFLTGQPIWRLGAGANLWSTLHPRHAVFPRLLEAVGYHVGHSRKVWGPGDWRALGRAHHPAGDEYESLDDFLSSKPEASPFCFSLGSYDPHRPYPWQSGSRGGIPVDKIDPPADLPNHETVRHDLADYYLAVQRFDRDVAAALKQLSQAGLLDNTIVVITSDHGMPFPRHKANLYDSGSRVPLAVRWPASIPGGRRVTDFVSLTDLAPTLLKACAVPTPSEMSGRSLLMTLTSERSGRVDLNRDHVLVGLERHGQAQESPNPGGYPCRALRTDGYLLVWNVDPERWPGGCPLPEKAYCGKAFGNSDRGPTRDLLATNRLAEPFSFYYNLAFAKRPEHELYDLQSDPEQLHNVYNKPGYREASSKLKQRLVTQLRDTGDPRVVGGGEAFDSYPFRR